MDCSSRVRAGPVDELERDFGKFVLVEDLVDAYASDGDDNSNAEEECEDIKPHVCEPVKKCLGKSATFPCNDKSSPDDEVEDDGEPEMALRILFKEESVQLHRTLSLPLVSAVKGSREKLGAAPRKLTVTWAPDVYDPVPNSLSHTVKGKPKKSGKDKDKDNNYKKKNKKWRKGNTSHRGGGGGKEKKQFRKHGGRSDHCQRTMDVVDRFVHTSGGLDDFDVGSPDYCGSSFLKESLTKVHYSVAEAS